MSKIKHIIKNNFLKSVVAVLSGIAVGQLINVLTTPLIGRLYQPADFGVFTVAMATVSIFSSLFAAGYPYAIPSIKEDHEAFRVLLLCFKLANIACVFALLLVVPFFLHRGVAIVFVPVVIWFGLKENALLAWLNRKNLFGYVSGIRVSQSIATAFTSVVLGYKGFGAVGLLAASSIGLGLANVISFRLIKEDSLSFNDFKAFETAWKWREYPKNMLTTNVIQMATYQTFPLLLTFLYGTTTTGHYGMSMKIVGLFATLCGSSVAQVFQPIASKRFAKENNCESLFLKTLMLISILTFLISIFCWFYLPWVVNWMLGEKWNEAISMFFWLGPQAAMTVIATSIGSVKRIPGVTFLERKVFIVSSALTFLATALGWFLGNREVSGLVLGFSLGNSLGYCYNIWVSWRVSTGYYTKKVIA